MQFQFDARGYAPSQGMEIWPGGWYQLVITGHDFKQTADGKGKRLVLNVVGNGDENGKRGQPNVIGLNLVNDNPTTVQIAYETLSAICWVIGKPAINDVSELHGIPFWAMAIADTQSNNWRNFKNMQGVDAIQCAKAGGGNTTRGNTGQQQPQQPQQPQGGWQPGGQPQGFQPQQQPQQSPQGGGWQPPGGTAPPSQQPGGWGPPNPGGAPPPQQSQQPGWGPPGGGQPPQQQPQGGWQPGAPQQGGTPPWGR